ncbi:MAG: hypothetical protein RMJ86_06730 [Anaerolineae bacterium]|nr:hypothetical protein [Thermoflexales bacterium]MDW8054221.1 hypothetical protein [Anaerolineae bacterium]MDW8292259.1 hypothetical protein [Anaerolineae bacterium]
MTEPTALHEADAAGEAARAPVDRKVAWVALLATALLLTLLAGAVFALTRDPERTANLRDIAIILLVVSLLFINFAVGVLLVVVLFRLQELLGFLRGELVPLLRDTTKAVRTVRGTATFVSDNVARPIIQAAGWAAGAQQFARSLSRRLQKQRRH